MKTKFIFFALGILSLVGLTGCGDDNHPPSGVSTETFVVQFRISPEPEINPYSGTKSIPELPSEPVTSKAEEEGEPTFSHIEYAVYDAVADTLVHHLTFSDDDPSLDDFGTFVYDTLRAGRYHICVMTHSVPGTGFEDNILTFPTIGDTFYGSILADVNVNTAGEVKEILLRRMVSRVEFVATDTVPAKVKSLHVSVAERYNKFNLRDGETLAEATPAFSYEHVFTTEERGKDIYNTHAFFTLVPPDAGVKLSEATLIAKDNDGNEVRKRIKKDIPVVMNKITRYKGILYTPGIVDDSFKLTLENEGKWDAPHEEDLPDE